MQGKDLNELFTNCSWKQSSMDSLYFEAIHRLEPRSLWPSPSTLIGGVTTFVLGFRVISMSEISMILRINP